MQHPEALPAYNGLWLGFGKTKTEKEHKTVEKMKDMDQVKLKTAPVHNLDSERALCSVNYSLKVRGNSFLSFSKCSDLFRLKRKGKNLSSAENASNPIIYLVNINCNVNMSFRDFREALNSISKE